MKLASSFTVPGSPDKVLTLFLDPAIMQACVPGCEDLTQVDETHYQGTLVNEVAHVKFKAGFVAEITERDIPTDTTRPAQVKAVFKGEDRRLGSTIKLDATLTVSPLTSGDGDTSQVSYEMEMAMWGKLGRLGESVIRRRTAEVEAQFAEALTAVCSGQPVPQRTPKGRAGRAAQAAAQPAATRPATTQPAAGAPGAAAAGEVATGVVGAGVQPTVAAGQAVPAGVAPRGREDWVVLGLAVAAAFAYGVLAGGRRRKAER